MVSVSVTVQHHPTQEGEVCRRNRFYLQVNSHFSNIICDVLLAIFLAALSIHLQVVLFISFEVEKYENFLVKVLHTLL